VSSKIYVLFSLQTTKKKDPPYLAMRPALRILTDAEGAVPRTRTEDSRIKMTNIGTSIATRRPTKYVLSHLR